MALGQSRLPRTGALRGTQPFRFLPSPGAPGVCTGRSPTCGEAHPVRAAAGWEGPQFVGELSTETSRMDGAQAMSNPGP